MGKKNNLKSLVEFFESEGLRWQSRSWEKKKRTLKKEREKRIKSQRASQKNAENLESDFDLTLLINFVKLSYIKINFWGCRSVLISGFLLTKIAEAFI